MPIQPILKRNMVLLQCFPQHLIQRHPRTRISSPSLSLSHLRTQQSGPRADNIGNLRRTERKHLLLFFKQLFLQ